MPTNFKDILSRLRLLSYTIDLDIIGEGSQTAGTYVGGNLDYTNINSDDGLVSTLRAYYASWYYHCWIMKQILQLMGARYVKMTYWAWTDNYSGVITPYVRISGTNYYGTQITTPNGYYTYQWDLNPATLDKWTANAINNAEWGARLWGGTGYTYISYMKLTVAFDFFKDIATRIKVLRGNIIDISTRLIVIVNIGYKDIATRLYVILQPFKDIATRIKIIVQNFHDITTRIKITVQAFKDVATRLKIIIQGFKDISSRLKLIARGYKDIHLLLKVSTGGYADAHTRLNIFASPLRTTLAARQLTAVRNLPSVRNVVY